MRTTLWKWIGRTVPAVALTGGTLALASGMGSDSSLPAPELTELTSGETPTPSSSALDGDDWTPMKAPASPSKPTPTKAGSGSTGSGTAPPPVVKQKGKNKPNKKP
jgi:hypothetical protein